MEENVTNVSTPQVSASDINESSSHVITDFLVQYAKTKNDKVKYTPEKQQEAETKISELNTKHQNDFESKAKAIRNAARVLIDANEEKEKALIKLSKPKLKAQFRLERFNKTKDDLQENNQPYDPVKTTFEEELNKLNTTDEENKAKAEQASDEKNENNDTKQENDVISQGVKAKNETKEKQDTPPKSKPETKTIKGNARTIAKDVGSKYDKQIDEYKAKSLKNIDAVRKTIEGNAQKRGYELGAKDVQKYNDAIKKQAKKAFDKKKNLMSKAETKKNSLIQKVKLKLGALLGL